MCVFKENKCLHKDKSLDGLDVCLIRIRNRVSVLVTEVKVDSRMSSEDIKSNMCVLWLESGSETSWAEGMSWAVNPIFGHMDSQMSLHSELQMSSLKKSSSNQWEWGARGEYRVSLRTPSAKAHIS